MIINGGVVTYEVLGDSGDFVVLTPGGRFGKDVPGLRALGHAIAADGHRVLLWDRPNCGSSDVQFYGQTESHMRAETLYRLIRDLNIGPCTLAGGSAGSRDSVLTALLFPEVVSRLVLWNIVGGVFGTVYLASTYVLPSIRALFSRGVEGLVELPEWRARIEANPANKQRFYDMGTDALLEVLLRWLNAFIPQTGQTLPGVRDEMFEDIDCPAMIIRGGERDLDHPKHTSLAVNSLIKNSELVEPPWPEDAWAQSLRAAATGRIDITRIFDDWVKAATPILDFLNR